MTMEYSIQSILWVPYLTLNKSRFAQQKLVGSEKCFQPNSIIRVDQC